MYLNALSAGFTRTSKLAFTCGSVIVSALVQQVHAQGQFEGFYGHVGVGMNKTNLNLSSTSFTVPVNPFSYSTTSSINNSSNLTGEVTAGYLKQINDRFLLGVNLDAHPFSSTANTYGLSIATPRVTTVAGSLQTRNNYTVSITPAWETTPDSLAYLKLGYVWGSVDKNYTTTNNGASSYASQSIDLSGTALGAGFKYIVTSHIYSFTEFNYVFKKDNTQSISRTTAGVTGNYAATVSGSYYNGLIGVGYLF